MNPIRTRFEEIQRQARIDDALSMLSKHFFDPAARKRLISGAALSSRNRNSNGTAFRAQGMTFTLPTPLLIDHDWDRPVGRVVQLAVFGDRLIFTAEVGNDMRVCHDLWVDLVVRSVTGVSVGADPVDAVTSNGTFERWRLDEISLVRTGADPGAVITRCWEREPAVFLNRPSEILHWSAS